MWDDLHKSPEETYLTEISIVTGEVDNHIKHLKKWSRPKRITTPIHLLPSSSKIMYEPLGVALIVAPWNYPFLLLISALVGSISAGCCSVLKPSPDTPTVAKVMEDMISENFDSNYISVVQGGRETNTILFSQPFNIIFFTGSPKVGKVVMKDEIFGPILPVITFEHTDETISYINQNEKPLAFYYFGKNKGAKDVLAKTTSGGACVNDTLMHITNHNLPFGGVGNSGIFS